MTEIAMRREQKERRLRLGFGIEAMKKRKVCTACGTICCTNESRCRTCGAELPKETLYELYRARHRQCGHCHAIVPPEASFCPACGRKLREKSNDQSTDQSPDQSCSQTNLF